jgi:Ser/Thr protein kinase RdoA (MazF antagonist)
MIWDFIDPRRATYESESVLGLLEEYGECLARIHSLPIEWEPQVRQFLYRIEAKDLPGGPEFLKVLKWVESHPLYQARNFANVFVHGDLNVGSVLIAAGKVSGIVDWEFAGMGWREYDLAWILRARTAFLHTQEERDAVLRGYRRVADFDHETLRFAEAINYLRFTKWTPTEAGRIFFLGRAWMAVKL